MSCYASIDLTGCSPVGSNAKLPNFRKKMRKFAKNYFMEEQINEFPFSHKDETFRMNGTINLSHDDEWKPELIEICQKTNTFLDIHFACGDGFPTQFWTANIDPTEVGEEWYETDPDVPSWIHTIEVADSPNADAFAFWIYTLAKNKNLPVQFKNRTIQIEFDTSYSSAIEDLILNDQTTDFQKFSDCSFNTSMKAKADDLEYENNCVELEVWKSSFNMIDYCGEV